MKTSKAQLVADFQASQIQVHAIEQALNAVLLNQEISPAYRSKNYTVRVARPCWAHGGVVMVTFHPADNPGQRPFTSAHMWEHWYALRRDDYIASIDPHSEAYELRKLALMAFGWVKEEQRKDDLKEVAA